MTGIKRPGFDSVTLAAVVDELQAMIVGAQIQHIGQPALLELVLTLRGGGRTMHLLLSCEADKARMHPIASRPASLPSPASFCMACRKYLEGGRVSSVEQVGRDRIARILVCHGGAVYTLVAEFMGRHSNLMLLDSVGRVLAAAKVVPSSQSRTRPIRPGVPYVSPPVSRGERLPLPPEPPDIVTSLSDAAELEKVLVERFDGVSPFFAGLLASRAAEVGVQQAWQSTVGAVLAGQWHPVLVHNDACEVVGAYPLSVAGYPGLRESPVQSIGMALDDAARHIRERETREALSQELQRAVRGSQRAREAQRRDILAQLAEASRAQEWRRYADLLVAAGPTMEVAGNLAWVRNVYSEEEPRVAVPIIPGKSPMETAMAYYERARKLDRAEQHLRRRLEHIEQELTLLASALRRCEQNAELQSGELAGIREDLQRRGLIRLQRRAEPRSARNEGMTRLAGIQTVHIPEGYEVLLGRTADANQRLLKLCAPDDLWFHVRAGTSAHVVVRTHSQPDRVPEQVIRHAACLAALNSASRHSSYVAVDYTLRKFVRPLRGGPAGKVTYSHHRTIDVSPDECREYLGSRNSECL